MKEIKSTTVADKVLSLEVNSIVFVRKGGLDYILHRTGNDGWLVTRPLDGFNLTHGYYGNKNILEFLDNNPSALVYLLKEGSDA